MSPFDFTLFVSIVVLGFYALNGIRLLDSSQSFDGYFLAHRQLTHTNVRNTFAGAAISISTVLSFFLTLGVLFGIQILWSPFTLALGVLFFSHVVYPRLLARPELVAALRGEAAATVDSLTDLVRLQYGSTRLASLVVGLSAVGVFAILVAEMMVGVTIYERYFLQPQYLVFVIAATLYLYAAFGGLKAVVETDRWQVRLIAVSLLVVVVVLAVQELRLGRPVSPGFLDILNSATWRPQIRMPLALWVNIFLVNLTFLPSSIRVWQVVVGASKASSFRRALWQATGIIIFVTLMSLLVSRSMLGLLGRAPDLPSIFAHLAGSPHTIVAYAVYPMLIVSMLSALVSTADSAILPLAQVLSTKARWTVRDGYTMVAAILAVSVACYFVVTVWFSLSLVAWILTVFSITTCIAPVVLCPLFLRPRRFGAAAILLIELGVTSGFLLALAWSVYFSSDLSLQPWNCFIGLAVSMLSTLIAFAMSPMRDNELRQN